MEKRNIVVIEATSSGINYIHDIKELGYNPVCVELYCSEDEREQSHFLHSLQYSLVADEEPDVLFADETYEKTFEMIKELDPLAIIPGSDLGIEWATKMSYELGLPTNNPNILERMVSKKCMQESLKNANLRHIRSRAISSFEEAKAFSSEIGSSKVVIKPSIGRASIGVCICNNDDEIRDAIELDKDVVEHEGVGEMIIQEYIDGDEYVLDSVSSDGINRITAGYKYNKITLEGGAAIYDYLITVDENDPIFRKIMDYHRKVVPAIGIEYGAIHAEYKVDENGPVLMEVNCRVNGGLQVYPVEDAAWGEHHAGASLEAYLNHEEFLKKRDKPLKMINYYIRKDLIMPEECFVKKSYVDTVFSDLESFNCAISLGGGRIYPKTIDLSTVGGIIHLTNNDKEKILEDVKTIKGIEQHEIEKIFDIES